MVGIRAGCVQIRTVLVVSCLFFVFDEIFIWGSKTCPHNGTDPIFARYFFVFVKKIAFERRLKKRLSQLRDDVTLKATGIKNKIFYTVKIFTCNVHVLYYWN